MEAKDSAKALPVPELQKFTSKDTDNTVAMQPVVDAIDILNSGPDRGTQRTATAVIGTQER